jgi:CRP-like cAMP-binding protein
VLLSRDRAYLEALNSPVLGWGVDRLDPAAGVADVAAILERCDTRPPVERVPPELPRRLAETEGGILAGLSEDEVAAIVERSHVIGLDPGAVLIRRGQVSRMVYVVLEGSLVAGEDHVAGVGEALGEVAFLTGGTRTAEVVAGPNGARVLTVSERTLRKLIESRSETAAVLALNLARLLAQRLAGTAGE